MKRHFVEVRVWMQTRGECGVSIKPLNYWIVGQIRSLCVATKPLSWELSNRNAILWKSEYECKQGESVGLALSLWITESSAKSGAFALLQSLFLESSQIETPFCGSQSMNANKGSVKLIFFSIYLTNYFFTYLINLFMKYQSYPMHR